MCDQEKCRLGGTGYQPEHQAVIVTASRAPLACQMNRGVLPTPLFCTEPSRLRHTRSHRPRHEVIRVPMTTEAPASVKLALGRLQETALITTHQAIREGR